MKKKIHVFIVGSKGIPAKYGGFETFVENLTARKKSEEILYHVSCMDNDEKDNFIVINIEHLGENNEPLYLVRGEVCRCCGKKKCTRNDSCNL